MRFTLEKWAGRKSRHTCPACRTANQFVRYIDTEGGEKLADHVGRCNRESKCGYHFKPRDYFAENSDKQNQTQKSSIPRDRFRLDNKTKLSSRPKQKCAAVAEMVLDKRHLIQSIANYEQNSFVRFLLELFPQDAEAVEAAVKEYLVGTGLDGETIFWQVDLDHRVRTGKLILYDPKTGKRRKDKPPNWIHARLKRSGNLSDNFELRQCFFGEHLLLKYPGRPIAIVEAEKTAVIASICRGVFPDLTWIACGGLSNLSSESLVRIGRDRLILLFPDSGAFDRWQRIASEARKRGLTVKVSDLLEPSAAIEQKREGLDLADYLIGEQQKRNDPTIREEFRTLIEERLAIQIIDGNLSESEAEMSIMQLGFYDKALQSVLR